MTKNMAVKSDLLKDAEAFLKVTDECVKKFVELLQSNEKEEIIKEKIKEFDVRDEMLKAIYKDCGCEKYKESAGHQDFRKAFEEFPRDNVLAWTEFGKIWAAKDLLDYDYDASLLMNYVYYKIYPSLFADCEVKKSGAYEYVIQTKEGSQYRGDTMHSFQTTVNQFRKLHGGEYFVELVQTEKNGWTLEKKGNIDQDKYFFAPWEYFYCNPSNYKKPLPPYITKFMKVVYTIGNFIPIPVGCNGPRVTGLLKDYWDLTLACIYNYYAKEDKIIQEVTGKEYRIDMIFSGDKKRKEHLERFVKWLNKFDGWKDFVKKNFMQPFVEEGFGWPRELWRDHFTKGVMPTEPTDFEQFFARTSEMIQSRGELMADKLKERLKNTPKETP